jgi:hypothetical protein
MKLVLSAVLVAAASFASSSSQAWLTSSKAECLGDCSRGTVGQLCAVQSPDRPQMPMGISCNDTSDIDRGSPAVPCGSGAMCDTWGAISPFDTLEGYCASGGTVYDVQVDCKPSNENDPRYVIGAVKVECNGDCNQVTVGEACNTLGSDWRPVGLACDETATPGTGTSVPCGSGTCTSWGTLWSSDPLGAYCADGGGYDAAVECTTDPHPFSVSVVKVETYGNPSGILVGDVCAQTGQGSFFKVRCDELANPPRGAEVACGTYNELICRSAGGSATDLLSAYCGDGDGNDAVVICTNDPLPD